MPIDMTISQQELDGIVSRAWWVRLLEMMQKHWALAETNDHGTTVYFVDDLGNVFDKVTCNSAGNARKLLGEAGFQTYTDNPRLRRFLRPPERPLNCDTIREEPIYSGGKTAEGAAS